VYGIEIELGDDLQVLKLSYWPSSDELAAEYGYECLVADFDFPDILHAQTEYQAVADLVEACVAELDSYSRWLGRHSGDRSLKVASLLPGVLLQEAEFDGLAELKTWLLTKLSGSGPCVDAQELVSHWPSGDISKLPKAELVMFLELLGKLGYGAEPDVRFGAPSLDKAKAAVLFEAGEFADDEPSDSYLAARMALHLSSHVALADGVIDDQERQLLDSQLDGSLPFSDAERNRLRAHLEWLLVEKPGLAGQKRALAKIPKSQQQNIKRFVLLVAMAGGRSGRKEVQALGQVYKVFGLDPVQVHKDIHSLAAVGSPEPVTVRAARPGETGFAIPPPPSGEAHAAEHEAATSGVQLDMELVRRRLSETESVANLLGEIFAEEEATPSPSQDEDVEAPIGKTSAVGHLEPEIRGFARALVVKPLWSRSEVEELAKPFNILVDGALEIINDLAWNECDAPLCEGDDPVEIDAQVAQELFS